MATGLTVLVRLAGRLRPRRPSLFATKARRRAASILVPIPIGLAANAVAGVPAAIIGPLTALARPFCAAECPRHTKRFPNRPDALRRTGNRTASGSEDVVIADRPRPTAQLASEDVGAALLIAA